MPNAMPRPASQEKHDDHQFPHPKSISKASPAMHMRVFPSRVVPQFCWPKQASHVSKEVNGKRLACCSFHAKGRPRPAHRQEQAACSSPISSQILQNLTF
ncbi:hypothetical protein QL285_097816 [Trifolium repens]|nr:hypothetical protein QL285_097816 [Trifolium repens]